MKGEELARSALEMAQQTEAPGLQADAMAELASVLQIAGRPAEARAVACDAIALYQAKGNVASERRVRQWTDELPAA